MLLESGAIELMGLDDSGEPTYRITKKCEEVFPEFYGYHRSMMNTTANELWQMGVIEMKFTSKGETVTFNYQNYSKLKEVMHKLTSEQIAFLAVLGAPVERL